MADFTQFNFQMQGTHDITVVDPDKRKIVADEMTLRFVRQPAELEVAVWTIFKDGTASASALTTGIVFTLADNIIFRDRVKKWLKIVTAEFDDFRLHLADLDQSEHEILIADGIVTFKFEIEAGILQQGTFEDGEFNFIRPTAINMNWSEFLLWQVFQDELLAIARNGV